MINEQEKLLYLKKKYIGVESVYDLAFIEYIIYKSVQEASVWGKMYSIYR